MDLRKKKTFGLMFHGLKSKVYFFRATIMKVLYLASHYDNPGGVEVYLLNYATEMRRRGFEVRIAVFEPLPSTPHWCLAAVRARGLSIVSLSGGLGLAGVVRVALGVLRGCGLAGMRRWELKKRQIANLKALLEREQPDIVHVKGRLIAEAWPVLPAERTVFHIATAGRRDESWDDAEVAVFRRFVERCARVFAPGAGVAETFKREFGIERAVDVVFTMAPEEKDE